MKYLKKYESFEDDYDDDDNEDKNPILTEIEATELCEKLEDIDWNYGWYQSVMEGDDQPCHHLDYNSDIDIRARFGIGYLQFNIYDVSDDDFLVHVNDDEDDSILKDFDQLKSLLYLVEEFSRLIPDAQTLEEHRIDCGLESGLNEYETLQEFKDAIQTIKFLKDDHSYIFDGKEMGLL